MVALNELLQALLDVLWLGGTPPVLLSGEVQNPLVWRLVQPERPNSKSAQLTQAAVLRIHIWECRLEIFGDALAHDAHGIDRVDERLRRSLQ